MHRRRFLACAITAAALAASPHAGAADADLAAARGFLDRIYAKYTAKTDADGVDLSSDTEIRRIFDPPLATLIIADRQRSERNDEPPMLDGDPFVDAQDWLISDLTIAVTRGAEPATVVAEVQFSNLDQPVHIHIDLVRLASGWRVHEITYSSTTLSRILSGR